MYKTADARWFENTHCAFRFICFTRAFRELSKKIEYFSQSEAMGNCVCLAFRDVPVDGLRDQFFCSPDIVEVENGMDALKLSEESSVFDVSTADSVHENVSSDQDVHHLSPPLPPAPSPFDDLDGVVPDEPDVVVVEVHGLPQHAPALHGLQAPAPQGLPLGQEPPQVAGAPLDGQQGDGEPGHVEQDVGEQADVEQDGGEQADVGQDGGEHGDGNEPEHVAGGGNGAVGQAAVAVLAFEDGEAGLPDHDPLGHLNGGAHGGEGAGAADGQGQLDDIGAAGPADAAVEDQDAADQDVLYLELPIHDLTEVGAEEARRILLRVWDLILRDFTVIRSEGPNFTVVSVSPSGRVTRVLMTQLFNPRD